MTIFSKIIRGEIPCYKIAEDDHFFAFLDINPVQMGHVLVVPKREEDYLFDLTPEELAGLMAMAQRVAKAIQKVTACRKVSLVGIGLEVPHAHLHLIPINEESDLNFRNKLTPSATDLSAMAQKLVEAL